MQYAAYAVIWWLCAGVVATGDVDDCVPVINVQLTSSNGVHSGSEDRFALYAYHVDGKRRYVGDICCVAIGETVNLELTLGWPRVDLAGIELKAYKTSVDGWHLSRIKIQAPDYTWDTYRGGWIKYISYKLNMRSLYRSTLTEGNVTTPCLPPRPVTTIHDGYRSATYNETTFVLTPSGVEVLHSLIYVGLIQLAGVVSLVADSGDLYVLRHAMLLVYHLGEEGEMPQMTAEYTVADMPVGLAVVGDTALVATRDRVYAIDLQEERTAVTSTVDVEGCRGVVVAGGLLAAVGEWEVTLHDPSSLEQVGVFVTGRGAVVSGDGDGLLFIGDSSGVLQGWDVAPRRGTATSLSHVSLVFSFSGMPAGVAVSPTSLSYSPDTRLAYYAYKQNPCSVYGCGVVWRVDVATGEARLLYTLNSDIRSVDTVNATHVMMCYGGEGCSVRDVATFRTHYTNNRLVTEEPVATPVPTEVKKVGSKSFFSEHSTKFVACAALLVGGVLIIYVRMLVIYYNCNGQQQGRTEPDAEEDGRQSPDKVTVPPLPPQPYGEDIPAPEHMICPISLEIMVEPVKCIDGYHSFEKYHMERFLRNVKGECPVSRQAMKVDDLTPNTQLKEEILAWVQRYREESERAKEEEEKNEKEKKVVMDNESVGSEPSCLESVGSDEDHEEGETEEDDMSSSNTDDMV